MKHSKKIKKQNFKQHQAKITSFLKNYKKSYGDESPYKLQVSDAIFCAEDIIRNRAFYCAIQEAIYDYQRQSYWKIFRHIRKRKIHVVDAGSGTGILGIFALIHGASQVTFIEHNPHSLAINKQLIKNYGYTEQSTFILGDATKIRLEKKFDILISETITIDFQTEDFIPIIKHLSQREKKKSIYIPEAFTFGNRKTSIKELNIEKINRQKGNTCHLYKKHQIKTGECISFFNQSVNDLIKKEIKAG